MNVNPADLRCFLDKWQGTLRLKDWDIDLRLVKKPWRKSGDIKIDRDDRKAVLLVNVENPRQQNAEALIVHELLHLKLWPLDQMIEELLDAVYDREEADPRREFAFTQFMTALESTVEDLAKGYMAIGGEDRTVSFGRLEREVQAEIGGEGEG